MKLFTIGDSISQGFMNGAAARTDQSFSTLLATAMGLKPDSQKQDSTDYYYPEWKKGGLPANIEDIFRHINRCYGSEIRGLEWLTTLHNLNRIIDKSEDYYERGEGRAENKYHGNCPYFHNVSSWSYEIADSWLVTPQTCMEVIEKQKPIDGGDGWLAIANAAFYRSALKVLSPNLDHNFSQLDWLKYHAQNEGIENLILLLGSNNAIKTIVNLKTTQTPGNPNISPHQMSHLERRKYNWTLWHPTDFKNEYTELLNRVDSIMSQYNKFKTWKVFIGTIPYLTLVPLLKGIGPSVKLGKQGNYFKYYTYVPFEESFALKKRIYLNLHRALYIDDCVNEYNRIIKDLIRQKNEDYMEESHHTPYSIVDVSEAFKRMDWRRNGGNPDYQYPPNVENHSPHINSKYYHADAEGNPQAGGLFSLDGVHPSIVGQGLIAYEFMKVMKDAHVQFHTPLNWEEIINNDTLLQSPITIMQELYRHENLAQFMVQLIQKFF